MTFIIHSAAALTGRIAGRQARRCFATSSVLRKDYVQDLYIKELKAYKPAPTAKDAHVGAVREFKAPTAPNPPSLPDLASELSAYESEEPALAEKASAAAKGDGAPEGKGKDESTLSGPALLAFLESDLPKDDLHHH